MSFAVENLTFFGIIVLRPRRLSDERGWFMETYRNDVFAELGITASFVQDNHVLSRTAGTLRGLHFQAPPKAQAKLVRVLRGAIYDAVVDIRCGSPTYGRWTGTRLSAEGGELLFVPAGFAHGYCTLESNTEIAYKCDAYYAPEHEGGISATDPDIGITWPFAVKAMTVSAKDAALPRLRDLDSPFQIEPDGG